MRHLVRAMMAVAVVLAGYSSEAIADNRFDRLIGGAIGGAILNELNRNNGRVIRRPAPRRANGSGAGGRWGPIAAVNGEGTTVCNTSDEAYACFALRCGKGRGTEFAFLFNRNDYGSAPTALIATDKGTTHQLQFTAIDQTRELVAAFSPSGHADLLRGLKAANRMTLDLGFKHNFSLRGSSRELDRALALCSTRQRGEMLVSQNGEMQRPSAGSGQNVNDIRSTSASFGGSCEAEQSYIEAQQQSITLNASASEIGAGDAVTLDWQGAGRKQRIPLYLVVATDHPIRFDGDGFVPLTPGAQAPFDIKTFKNKSRAIVPFASQQSKSSGQIKVLPLLAGKMKLEWSVVGYLRQCRQELPGKASNIDVTVKSFGAPSIVLDHTGELEEPKSRIAAPKGAPFPNRIIEVHEERYRLIDGLTGAEIVERAGREPRFSPTGRFLAVRNGNGFELVDVADGAIVHKDQTSGIVAWSHADSFAVFDRMIYGFVDIVATLQEDRKIVGTQTACHACGGADSGVRIDLENNIAVVAGDQGIGGASLSKKSKTDRGSASIQRLVRTQQLAPYSTPNRWELSEPIPFTHRFSRYVGEDTIDLPGKRSVLLEPRLVSNQTVAKLESGSPLARVEWRSLAVNPSPESSGEMLQRLSDFGVPVPAQIADETGAVFDRAVFRLGDARSEPTEEMRTAMTRILSEVPASKGSMGGGYSCYTDAEGKIPNRFQKAFRFQSGDRVLWLTHFTCADGSGGFHYPALSLFDTDHDDAWKVDQESVNPDNNVGNRCYSGLANCELDARIFGEKYLLLFASDSRAIEVYDIDARKKVFERYELPRGDLIKNAFVTPNQQSVVQLNSDGTFFAHRISDGKIILQGRYIDDEMVVWTPDMRFDATAEGAHFVNLRFPGQPGQYTFQQFDSRLRVEGLAQKVLSGSYEPQPTEVGVPPRLSGSLDVAGNRIGGTVTPRSLGELRGIRIYQDGVLTNEVLALESSEPVDIDVERLPGARWVAAVALDEEGLVSLPIGRDLGPDTQALAKVRLLAVGVDQYDNEAVTDLNLAVADANTLKASLEEVSGKSIELDSPVVLTDGDATSQAIMAAAEELVRQSRPGEQAVFFFAGHGVKGEDGRFYMATSATDPSNISGTALSWDELSAVLSKSKARMTVFLDACHSGAAGTDFFATNDDAASGILKNIPSGLTVFSASKGRELSEEDPAINGGQFTTAVARVIAGERETHDLNGNGVIEVSELYIGVKRQVVQRTDGRQTPWLARNQMVGDFALF